MFHDPDAGQSHRPEGGFGFLFYDSMDDRLSTASSPQELPVDNDGKHATGDKRYQVLMLGPATT